MSLLHVHTLNAWIVFYVLYCYLPLHKTVKEDNVYMMSCLYLLF